jgi:hypothetical protein
MDEVSPVLADRARCAPTDGRFHPFPSGSRHGLKRTIAPAGNSLRACFYSFRHKRLPAQPLCRQLSRFIRCAHGIGAFTCLRAVQGAPLGCGAGAVNGSIERENSDALIASRDDQVVAEIAGFAKWTLEY